MFTCLYEMLICWLSNRSPKSKFIAGRYDSLKISVFHTSFSRCFHLTFGSHGKCIVTNEIHQIHIYKPLSLHTPLHASTPLSLLSNDTPFAKMCDHWMKLWLFRKIQTRLSRIWIPSLSQCAPKIEHYNSVTRRNSSQLKAQSVLCLSSRSSL